MDSVRWIRRLAHQESRRAARAQRRPAAPAGDASPAPASIECLRHLPGIGEERAIALLQRFGSPHGVATAPIEALMGVPGIGPATAARLYVALRGG